MTELAVSVEGVSKRYTRRAGKRLLKDLVLHPIAALRRDRFWALHEVNVQIGVGETLGLIGANGSGKSTLLRLIGGLGLPSRGRIVRHREVEAMLSLGEGLNPLLTGRENAITAGILAGYRRRDISSRLEDITAFAELEEFIDMPLRTYSDGMRLRLAFSVAISSEPEVLLIDEVLAVGDLRFQEKCFNRLRELQEIGTTIVLASHDESQVRALCERVLWLAGGRVQALGQPDDVYEAYRRAMQAEVVRRAEAVSRTGASPAGLEGSSRSGTYEVEIVAVRIAPAEIQSSGPARGSSLRIEVDLLPHIPVDDPIVSVTLHRVADYTEVLDVNTDGDRVRLGRIAEPVTVALELDRVDVQPGSYRVDVGVHERSWAYVYDYHWHAYPLEIQSAGSGFGPARRWATSAGNGRQGRGR